MTTIRQLARQAKEAEARKGSVSEWLADLPETRRKALLEIAKRRGFDSVERLAVSLLAELETEVGAQRRHETVRRALCSVEKAEKHSAGIAAILRENQGAELIVINPNGSLSTETEYPAFVKAGMLVLDLRKPKPGSEKQDPRTLATDKTGKITAQSVAAWLLGYPRHDPRMEG